LPSIRSALAWSTAWRGRVALGLDVPTTVLARADAVIE